MTLKIVIGGLGVRGRHWAEVVNRSPDCEILAFADPNQAALDSAIEKCGDCHTFQTPEEALTNLDQVDALILANPPIGRESQVTEAANRGIPMLIEKPLALDLAEAAHLVSIAEAANVPMMVGLNFRYLGVTQHAMRLLTEGIVGQPAFARFTYERYRDGNRPDLNKYPLTMDHPMLWEQSIHHFDLMRFIYQQEPVSIKCHTWNPSWSMYEYDTNVAAIITFDGGLVVNYQGTWQSNWEQPHFEWRTECTQGIITQKEQFGDLFYAQHDDVALTPVDLPPHERWITETSGLLNAFVGTVRDNKPLECSGRDHLMSLSMLEACIRSSETDQGIVIEDMLAEVI